ncbi:MAG: branched-chain amino acid ABC transporter permease [Candidatus Nanopelagicales bacterium]|jgi:branched-chain amino acid transport system permease protein
MRRGLLATILLTLLSLGVGTAAAAETGSIGGNMVDETGAPIGGVEFNMTGPNNYDESTESDDQGNWAFEITEPGQYFVTINPDSLPSGVGLTEPDKVTRSVVVFKLETAPPPVRFLTGPGPERASTFDRAMQLTIDGLLLGVTIGLAAVGLSLIFGTTGLTNFAHGELLTLGGMMTYFFNKMGLHVIPSALIALVIAIVVGGFLQDRYLWKPLRKRGTGLIAMLVISIGFGLLARYVFLYLFGGDKQQFLQYAGQPGWQLGPISITPKATASALIGIVLIGLTIAWLLKSQLGKASRAVADNPALAASSGIDVERVIMVVWILGAFLAGYGGIMMGLNQGVQWIMGSDVLLLIFAAVTLGGLGTAYGAIVGSLIVGLFIQLSTLIIPTELKYVGALVVLILILLVRPQGIMGRRERIG